MSVRGVMNRKLEAIVVWLGDDGARNRYGRFRTDKKKYTEDGPQNFSVVYPDRKKKKFDKNFRGWAVCVINSEGKVVAEKASPVPFLRFLPKRLEKKGLN